MSRTKLAILKFHRHRKHVIHIDFIGRIFFGAFTTFALFAVFATGQTDNGSSTLRTKDTGNGADRNLRSSASVNPTTLALEFSIPMMSYPGRNGNSLPVGINYTSKVWQMENGMQWWYQQNTQTKFVTDIKPLFAERSAAGWTSELTPPRIDETPFQLYYEDGHPWNSDLVNEIGINNAWQSVLSGFLSNLMEPCGTRCTGYTHYWCDSCIPGYPGSTSVYVCNGHETVWCETGGGGGHWDPPTPTPLPIYFIKRTSVVMPDGSTREFRASDEPIFCGTTQTVCQPDKNGTYLSVDGSGTKLVRTANGSILYQPDGGRYLFGSISTQEGTYANQFIDVDGNTLRFETTSALNQFSGKWIDTMGREISDPLPHNWKSQTQTPGTKEVNLPSINGNVKYTLTWKHLKPVGCEESVDPNCGTGGVNGALEDQSQKLFFEAKYFCRGNSSTNLVTASGGNVLFQVQESGIRPCNTFNVQKDANLNVIIGTDGNPIPYATRFNPVVLAEVELPNGQKYEFKYNRHGEISRITFPTGAFETFEHSYITPINGGNSPAYDQTNRGVTERRVFDATGTIQQKYQYTAEAGKVTAIVSKGNDANANGAKTERYVTTSYSDGTNYGFNPPSAGMPREERVFDEDGGLRSRTFNNFVTKNGPLASRDLRPAGSISVNIENNVALAIKSETEYDETGSSEPEHFSHLNPKRTKGYNFAVIPISVAQSPATTFAQLDSYFNSSLLSNVTEFEYSYDAAYRSRGIKSLLTETRVLDPSNTSQVLAKTQTLYDEFPQEPSGNLPAPPAPLSGTWVNPSGDPTLPPNTFALRAKPTTVRVWDSDKQIWIFNHTKFDQYGNLRKVWEPNESVSSDRFVETQYSESFAFAYPTKVVSPAPDPTGVHGTTQGAESSTWYDFNSGLPISVTNDFGQVTKTEYNDPLRRPTRVFAFNFSAPETQKSYDDTNRTVTVRTQIDETNWDESTTFSDSLGRQVKTRAIDSQGNVFTETEYDLLGRVKRASNPYREGESKLWSSTEYDNVGRSKLLNGPDGSVFQTQYGMATVGDSIGLITTVIDQSERARRTIVDAHGLLLRIDEPNELGVLGEIASPAQPTFYEYDQLKNLKKVTQGAQVRTYLTDNLGRLKSVTNPESGTVTYEYDVRSNLTKRTDARGVNAHFEYDRSGRPVKRFYTNEVGYQTPQAETFYDGVGSSQAVPFSKGKLTKTVSANSTTQITAYDHLGNPLTQIETIDGRDYQLGYTYDFAGTLVEQTYPSGRVVRSEFNEDGSLRQVLSRKAAEPYRVYANDFKYNAAGKVSLFRYGNGRWETTDYNSRLQTAKISLGYSASNSDVFGITYGFGELRTDGTVDTVKNNGNLARQDVSVGRTGQAGSISIAQTFKYDSLKRLTDAKEIANGTQSWQQKFSYDRFGNRRFETANTTTFAPGCTEAKCNPLIDSANNRIAGGQGYTFDAGGNVITTPDNTTSSYDGENKLVEVRLTDTGTVLQKNFYDADGARVKIEQGALKTIFVQDITGKVVAEYTENAPANPQPTTSFLTLDILGSVRVATDSFGRIISRRDFLPFGEEIATGTGGRSIDQGYTAAASTRQKFTGQERDDTIQLDYFNARHYDFTRGRFTSADTVGGKQSNPQSLNLYAYALNNPLRWVDPTGHTPDNPSNNCTTCRIDDNNYLYDDKGDTWLLETARVTVNGPREPTSSGDQYGSSMRPLPSQMESSLWDLVPIVSGVREFAFNYSCAAQRGCNFNRAFGGFVWASVDGGTFGIFGRAKTGGQIIVTQIFEETVETGVTSGLRSGSTVAARTGLTNEQLVQKAANIAENKVGGVGSTAGTAKHKWAENLLTRYQQRFGDKGLLLERSFLDGKAVTSGTTDSVKLDVFDTTVDKVYDYKFVQKPPGLKTSQINKIKKQGPKSIQTIKEINPQKR